MGGQCSDRSPAPFPSPGASLAEPLNVNVMGLSEIRAQGEEGKMGALQGVQKTSVARALLP